MQVKELEITGFKSFVDRVKLNFKPGITALVGPNGCGKSNIIDAIRWIMGEHNARHLRGSKMEDLIFNGSETRKSTSMAEVSLVLSNGNGNGSSHASVLGNVSEIMLTRRLHRTGESEYFINKIPCRLKDIVEVFLDSGVGTKSYSIMEQGKVDFILSLKPDERRILIEEAAGVSKYRTRKKEALSKMESTKNNLARLKDILNELEIQMRALDLQVKRFKRHRNIREEIRQIELQLASRRLRALKTSQETIRHSLAALQDEQTQLIAQRDAAEATLQKDKLSLMELHTALQQLQSENFSAKEKIQLEESSIKLNEHEIQNVHDLLDKNTLALTKLQESLAHCEAELTARTKDETTLCQLIYGLENNFKDSLDSLSEAKSHLRDIQQAIENENQLYFNIRQESVTIRNSIGTNRRLHDELSLRLQKIEIDTQAAVANLDDIENKKRTLYQESIALREQHLQVQEKLCTTRLQLDSITESLHLKETALHEERDRCSGIRARLHSLQELQKNLEGYNDGVRTVMTESKNHASGFAGIICLLTEVIETSSQYESVVEAVLDKILQAIIVETPHDGLRAIEQLRKNRGGRVSFIARTAHTPSSAALSIDTQRLLSVLQIKDGFVDLAEAILGEILLTDTLASALAVWQSLERKTTIVTATGEVIDAHGIITGGSGDGRGAGILKRSREIREFTNELSVHESALADLQREKDELATQLSTSRQEIEAIIAEKQRLDIARIESEKNFEHAEREFALEQHRIDSLANEASSCRSAMEGHAQELMMLQENEALHLQAEEQKTKDICVLQEQAQLISTQLESSENSHADIRVNLASAQAELENIRSQITMLATQRQNTLSGMSQLHEEHELLNTKTSALGQAIAASKDHLISMIEHNRNLETNLEQMRVESQGLEAAVNNLEISIKELQRRREEIGPKIHELESQLTADDMHIEYLGKELYDKYLLTLHELPESAQGDSFSESESAGRLEELQKRLANIGDVNPGAAREYEELEQRYQHLQEQEQDLLQAIDSLQKVITKINRITRQKFFDTFTAVNEHFKQLFPMLFSGGKAYMQLTDETDLLETGIEVFAQPPGKKLQSLDLLSGGERALTVIAIMFSIFLTKPTPFCLMDEIDAPLDDTNIGRFITHLNTMAEKSQFIIITHNKLSMQAANSLYGVTMEEKGVSKIVSVQLN